MKIMDKSSRWQRAELLVFTAVTLLNLLPFGQLDGGHVLYALLGRWHRRVVFPLVALLVGLGFVWWPWWIWAGRGAILGLRHPWVPDEQQPLDPRRRAIALLCVVNERNIIFVKQRFKSF